MAKNTAPATDPQESESPHVLVKFTPAESPLFVAEHASKSLARIDAIKEIKNLKQLETASEVIDSAGITSDEIEEFVGKLRARIQEATERVREFKGYEDFEATLTIRKWGLRQMLNDGLGRLKNLRARYLADEQARINRENLAKQAEQDRINKKAADEAAAAAKKAGADKGTIAQIREEVMATTAPVVPSRAMETASAMGASLRYNYTAEITNLKSFLGFCLQNPVMYATLGAAIPDIEKAFRKMASDQKEAFKYPGIQFKKTPVDVARGGRF